MATFRYDVPVAAAADHRRRATQHELPRLAAEPGVAGCHLLVADEAASAVDTAERKARSEKNRIPRWIILVEGWGDAKPFDALCREAVSNRVLGGLGAEPAAFGLFQLQTTRGKTGAG
jgi:hypothetical protein